MTTTPLESLSAYWSLSPDQLLSACRTTPDGLERAEAEQRLKQYGLNAISARQQATALGLLAILGLTVLYMVATEVAKKYFYARVENARA